MPEHRCDFRAIIDKYYPDDNRLRAIYLKHAGQVAGLALAINRDRGLGVSTRMRSRERQCSTT